MSCAIYVHTRNSYDSTILSTILEHIPTSIAVWSTSENHAYTKACNSALLCCDCKDAYGMFRWQLYLFVPRTFHSVWSCPIHNCLHLQNHSGPRALVLKLYMVLETLGSSWMYSGVVPWITFLLVLKSTTSSPMIRNAQHERKCAHQVHPWLTVGIYHSWSVFVLFLSLPLLWNSCSISPDDIYCARALHRYELSLCWLICNVIHSSRNMSNWRLNAAMKSYVQGEPCPTVVQDLVVMTFDDWATEEVHVSKPQKDTSC